jgi:hypothetical protein
MIALWVAGAGGNLAISATGYWKCSKRAAWHRSGWAREPASPETIMLNYMALRLGPVST